MAKQVMPPARLETRPSDVRIPDELFLKLSLFAQLKRKPTLDKFPGTLVLRHFRPGEVVCRQGEAAWTAFYILRTEDVLELRQAQLKAGTPGLDVKAVQAEVAELGERLAQLKAAGPAGERRPAVSIHLTVARPAPPRVPGLVERLVRRWADLPDVTSSAAPLTIAIDAPTDVDYETLQAVLHEGELFGEMSCMYGTPRSATFIADRDCYMLELLRNILDQLQKDPAYKAQVDAAYKKQVFQLHMRRLSLFADLSEEQFEAVRDQVELITFEPGQIIYDEYERSDGVYLIRSGLVRVVKKASALLNQESVRNWSGLPTALREAEAQPASPRGKLWQLLAEPARAICRAATDAQPLRETERREILNCLNDLLRNRKLGEAKEFQGVITTQALAAANIPEVRKEWTDADARRFNRLLVEALFPGMIRVYHRRIGPDCVLFYAARGEFIGEQGVLSRQTRGESCLAFGHPKDTGGAKEAGPVELVRIPAAVFADLLEQAPALRRKVERKLTERRKQTQERVSVPVWDDSRQVLTSGRFEKLGLIQGQKLMVIDLDRCTRCDECVRACVDSHDDGNSRLFLDGPRLGKYLVPVSCRSCLDPVCMIGCPVGSIHRGDNGQIVIEDWCIGCGLCAGQCPYGSIHMHDVGIITEEARGWRYLPVSAVGKAPWTKPAFDDSKWLAGVAPFVNDREFRESVGVRVKRAKRTMAAPDLQAMEFTLSEFVMQNPALATSQVGEPVCFRQTFSLPREAFQSPSQFKLEIASPDSALTAWLNGQEIQPADKPKGGKREFWFGGKATGTTPAPAILRPGLNVLAIQVNPDLKAGEQFLKVRLDEVRKPALAADIAEEVTQKLVTERAVVCDLCSSQLGQVPACVTACPHDAALRIDARSEFPMR